MYPGCTPYRWVLEQPAGFTENNPVPANATVQIQYSITSPAAGNFNLQQFSWAGYNPANTNASFGYSESSDAQLVSFVPGVGTGTNTGPVLPPQASQTINELTALTVTNTATDTNLPAYVLSYSLPNSPAGATIDGNGIIQWTPGEAQGPGTNVLATVVTDNAVPPKSATNSFTVVVNEVNTAPVLPVQASRGMVGPATLVVTNTATDADIPANALTYQLLAAPSNASIDGNGVITWTPGSGQIPSTNTFTTMVTDFNPWAVNTQHLSATNTFTVTVTVAGICVSAPVGIVGWWPGDGNANDIAGTNNGTLQGGATATATGFDGTAFSFDGTNGFVQVPDSLVLKPTNLTVEAWVRFAGLDSAGNSPAGQQYIIFKQNTASSYFEGYSLNKARGGSGDYFAFVVSSASAQTAEVDSAPGIQTNVWYHVAAVRGTNFIQLYVNGQLAGQATVGFAQNYGTLPLYFGTSGQSYWDHKFKGSLDEVSLYYRALSAAEIVAIYTAGAGGKCKAGGGLSIVAQPQSQTVPAGGAALFTVTAMGKAPLGYQWQFNGTALTGATNTNLTLGNVQPANGGSYTVVVTNSSASVTSAVAVLTVLVPPAITTQPQSLTNVTGTTASFNGTATGGTPLNYQWRLNGVNLANGGRLSGATTGTLTISNVQPADAGSYILVVTNGAGAATSAVATLTVNGPPVITTPPASQAVVAGISVNFSVTASGTQPLSYQWRFNGSNLADGGQISGSGGATLTVSNVQPANAGSYLVMVTNVAGSATSATATLSVTVPGNCVSAPAGIVGWWPGDGNANDIAGTNNGTLQGGATATATGLDGMAFSFDGTNGFVQIPDSPALKPTNLTVEAWVRFSSLDSAGSSTAGQQYLIFKQNTRSSNFEGYSLNKARGGSGDYFAFVVSSSAGQVVKVSSAPGIQTNVWYHVAGVRGTNFVQLYVNGQLAGQASVTFVQNYGTTPLYLGTSGQSYWDHKLKGWLDEASLYNRALSAGEIAAIYGAGAAGKCKGLAPAARLAQTVPGVNEAPAITQIPVTFSYKSPDKTVQFRFHGTPGRSYEVQWCPTLLGTWKWLATVNADASGEVVYDGPAPGETAFFRVVLP